MAILIPPIRTQKSPRIFRKIHEEIISVRPLNMSIIPASLLGIRDAVITDDACVSHTMQVENSNRSLIIFPRVQHEDLAWQWSSLSSPGWCHANVTTQQENFLNGVTRTVWKFAECTTLYRYKITWVPTPSGQSSHTFKCHTRSNLQYNPFRLDKLCIKRAHKIHPSPLWHLQLERLVLRLRRQRLRDLQFNIELRTIGVQSTWRHLFHQVNGTRRPSTNFSSSRRFLMKVSPL